MRSHRLRIASLICVLAPAGQAIAFEDDGGRWASCVSITQALRLKLMLLALVCCILPIVTAVASYGDIDNTPIVVLRIDDCPIQWLTPFTGLGGVSGFDYGKSKHIPITWAIMTSYASAGSTLSWAQLKDYLDTCGGDPASHSVTHNAMPSQQAYIDEVVASKAAINANLPGYSCHTFIQPGGWAGDANMGSFAQLDNPIGQAIQANYSQSFAYLGTSWFVGNPYNLYRYGITINYSLDAQSKPSTATIGNMLDIVAATPGCIFMFTGHSVQEQGQNKDYGVPADILAYTMTQLASLRDQGKIRLMGFNEAMNTAFSPDINRVPDSGFEAINPALTTDPWKATGSARFVSPGGVGDSRYISMTDAYSVMNSSALSLGPGRCEMTWYQKLLDSRLNLGMYLRVTSQVHDQSVYKNSVDNSSIYCTTAGVWEKKTALLNIPDRLNLTTLSFVTWGGAYGIDNVSIVSAPVDPAVSVSASSVTPSIGQCSLSWHTPNDASITSIAVRYGSTIHPTTPTSGSFVCTTVAHPNTVQQISVPFDWTTMNCAFFSIFGVKADGGYVAPDLASVWIDKTPQSATPVVTLGIDPDGTIHAQWSISCPGIVQYQYAVGSTSGGSDVRTWATTTGTSAAITGLPYGFPCYVSVKAQNQYGVSSKTASVLTSPPPPAPPTVTLATDGDGTIHARWSCSDPVVQYRYAVGANPGGTEVRSWVTTTDTSATITGIAPNFSGYVSAQAQNAYNTWSASGSALIPAPLNPPISVSQACAHPDNDRISVIGTVTAVFGDCCYIEDANRCRGIKVVGSISSLHEGNTATVTGAISTDLNHERTITSE